MPETSDFVNITWPPYHQGGRSHEPQEKDPELQTLYSANMDAGDSYTFEVEYQTFKGPATIAFTAVNKTYKRSGLSRNGKLIFSIQKATTAHSGYYSVEVQDEGRKRVHSQNPAKSACTINVKSGWWCSIL